MFSQPSQDPEERAYMLLQWASRAPLAPFNAELADAGFYTRVQRASSDQAIKAWDAAKPADTSSELQAFRELERLGQITQAEFFSPSKAAQGIYRSTLKTHLQVYRSAQRKPRAETNSSPDRRNSKPDVSGLARPGRGPAINSDSRLASDQRPTSNRSQRRTYRATRRREDQS